ncbi:MAG: single-stranded DNA-binding protein [Chthoniobacteraceae bacterium]|nr:single-stranded DNA-binding protein [Chthoniobacteraceae bacterium]
MKQAPKEILDTMLGCLGFVCEIEENEADNGLTLQVYTSEKERLTGPAGQTIEDLQYLLNRVLQAQDPASSKVHVDVEHYRDMRNDQFVERVRKIAESVRASGIPFHLEPMNSYDRRLVHNAFKNDPQIATWSPDDDARMKRITLKLRSPA